MFFCVFQALIDALKKTGQTDLAVLLEGNAKKRIYQTHFKLAGWCQHQDYLIARKNIGCQYNMDGALFSKTIQSSVWCE